MILNSKIKDITNDSRKAGPGVAFFAIPGTKQDGHDFVDQALQAGAEVVFVQDGHPKIKNFRDNPKVAVVKDVRQVLGEAASEFFGNPSKNLKVLGVTGTNGKTTSTYLLEAIFNEAGEKTAVIGTIDQRMGKFQIPTQHTTPGAIELQRNLSVFKKQGATAVAIEVSSHALDQKRVAGMEFTAALFTNLTQDHLDYHASMESYFQAKARFFLDYPCQIRAINVDDFYGKKLITLCHERGFSVTTYGRKNADVCWQNLSITQNGISGDLTIGTKILSIKSPLVGSFNAQNLAGVVSVAVKLGISYQVIMRAVEKFHAVPGRMEKITNSKGLSVIVDYAHTPDALENVLKTLKPLCSGKLVLVFGCGGDRDPAKRPLMGKIAELYSDQVFVTSDNPRTEDPNAIISNILEGIQNQSKIVVEPDRRKAIGRAIRNLQSQDCLLIAGKGHEDYQIIGDQKLPFDDRAIARENLN